MIRDAIRECHCMSPYSCLQEDNLSSLMASHEPRRSSDAAVSSAEVMIRDLETRNDTQMIHAMIHVMILE